MQYVTLVCNDICLLLKQRQISENSLVRLQKELSQSVPENALERVFLAERVYQIGVTKNYIPKKTISQLLSNDTTDLPEKIPNPRSILTFIRIRRETIRFLSDTTHFINDSRKPWPKILNSFADHPPEPGDSGNTLFQKKADKFSKITAKSLVAIRCTMLAIGIERYRLANGKLPLSLDNIYPSYINSIPIDPFTGQKLLYRFNAEKYVIYSAGTNLKDDGGLIVLQTDQENPPDLGLSINILRLK